MNTVLTINTKDFGGYKNFHALLNRIKPFIFPDETRFNLNGIYFELKSNTTTLTATDGHKLYTEIFNINNEVEGNFTLSLEGIKKLLKIKQDYTFEVDKLKVKILDNEHKWIINAEFPEYEKVIPKENNFVLSYTKTDLKHKLLSEENDFIKQRLKSDNSIKSIQEYIERKDLLKIDFEKLIQYLTYQENNTLSLLAKKEQKTLERNKKLVYKLVKNENSGISLFKINEQTISFNRFYLRDIINAIEGDIISFNLLNPRTSAIFYEGNKRIILMPTRF